MSSLPYRLLFYAALAGVLLLHLSSHLELVLHRTGPTLTSTPSYVLPSGEILAIASANHRTAASDLVWINAILFTADLYRSRRHTGQITDFADAIVYLDGHFYPVYRWHRSSRIHLNRHVTREDIEEAIRVNERGLEYFPDSWELPQGIALTLIGGRLERTQEERIADLERVVFYDGTTELTEFTEPPFTELEWTGAASSDDPLYTAVAYQPAVSVDRNFVQYTSEFPTAWTGDDPEQAYTNWLEAHFAPAERDDPDLLFHDFNGNGQPALLDFLVGRDPKASHPPVQPEILRGEDDTVRARFRFRPAPQVAAVMEASADLQTWTPLLQSADWTLQPDGDEWILEADVTNGGDPAIIRVRATRR